jgi:hypothetical protein
MKPRRAIAIARGAVMIAVIARVVRVAKARGDAIVKRKLRRYPQH